MPACLQELMKQFADLREGEERVITIEDFAEHLNLPLTADVEHAFSLLDRDGNGVIEWKVWSRLGGGVGWARCGWFAACLAWPG